MLTTVALDEESGVLWFLSEKGSATKGIEVGKGLELVDLLVALVVIYETEQEPSFSLDPKDPKNVQGPWLKKV